ncbi:MAG: molybdopterin-dependent oxidoreductase [Burkholderiales bacterium]
MQTTLPARRRWLAAAALACAAWPAWALDAPKGPLLLTVTGALAHTNDGGAASFDMALLRAMPQTSFSTKTPWYPQPRKFTGVLVRDLLDVVGAKATTIRATALNDYRADMPADELIRNGAMIASLLDDEPMPVRDKGPLVIIFPFSDRPELRTAVHYSRAVWQLRSLELR